MGKQPKIKLENIVIPKLFTLCFDIFIVHCAFSNKILKLQ